MKEPRVRVAGILVEDKNVLLIKQSKGDKFYWLLPGGGLDYGESFEQCLEREFMEETSLKIEADELIFVSESIAPDKSRHIVNLYFKVDLIGGEIKIGDEHNLLELKYMNIDEIENSTIYPNIKKELIEYIKNGCKQPAKLISSRWE